MKENPTWRSNDRQKWVTDKPFVVKSTRGCSWKKTQNVTIDYQDPFCPLEKPFPKCKKVNETVRTDTEKERTFNNAKNTGKSVNQTNYKDFCKINTPRAPTFNVFSKNDAHFGDQTKSRSLRTARHLIDTHKLKPC